MRISGTLTSILVAEASFLRLFTRGQRRSGLFRTSMCICVKRLYALYNLPVFPALGVAYSYTTPHSRPSAAHSDITLPV